METEECRRSEGEAIGRTTWPGKPWAVQGAAEVAALCHDLELPSLAQAAGGRGKVEQAVMTTAADALASASPANNPRVPTEEEIVALYQKALGTA